MTAPWTALPERGNTPALNLIAWIGRHLGRRVARWLLYPITAHYFLTGAAPRKGSRLFLRRLWGREPSGWEVFCHFHCFAATLLDRLYLLIGQHQHFQLRIHGGEEILRLAAAGKGCLLLGSHLGSFEVLRVHGLSHKGLPVRIVMDTDHNTTATRFFAALNREIFATTLARGSPDLLLKVVDCLEQGQLVGLLGDRLVGRDRAVRCQFLGGEALFPTGPVVLAALARCPVILCFALCRGDGRYDLHFEPFADLITLDRQSRQRDVQTWVQRYADRLEHYTRLAPYNWFNFYDFWLADDT
ncbi:MAG: lipid A biosynthesis acyltransferase [Candidatus Competibacterales bacterium]